MRTAQEIDSNIQNYQNLAGQKVLSLDSYKDLANIVEIIYIDGFVKALQWVKEEN